MAHSLQCDDYDLTNSACPDCVPGCSCGEACVGCDDDDDSDDADDFDAWLVQVDITSRASSYDSAEMLDMHRVADGYNSGGERTRPSSPTWHNFADMPDLVMNIHRGPRLDQLLMIRDEHDAKIDADACLTVGAKTPDIEYFPPSHSWVIRLTLCIGEPAY